MKFFKKIIFPKKYFFLKLSFNHAYLYTGKHDVVSFTYFPKGKCILIFENLKNVIFLENTFSLNTTFLFNNCSSVFYVRNLRNKNNFFENNFYFLNSSIHLTHIFSDSITFSQENFLMKNSELFQNDVSFFDTSRASLSINTHHVSRSTKSFLSLRNIVYKSSFLNHQALINILKLSENSNAFLEMKSLLLSKTSKVRMVPSLVVLPKNIKANHSANIEHITPEQLFYLGSRSLSSRLSKLLIYSSFLKYNFSEYPDFLRDYLFKEIDIFLKKL